MPQTRLEYAADAALTITLASLGNGAYRESDAVDNSTDLYLDALVAGKITTGTSASANGVVNIWAYASVDGGTIYTAGATGSDAAISLDAPEARNLFLVGVISTDNTSDQTYEFGPFSVASAFGGYLPQHWGLIVENSTGVALNATGGNHAINWQGIYIQAS